MKIALIYDRVNKWGGAERVLLALHELWPDAPLYTAVYDLEAAPWAKVFDIRTSFLRFMPFAKQHHELYPWLTPLAFESFSFDSFDVVVSVTSAEAKYIITKPGTLHICYCLTPTRYLWSGHELYRHLPGLGALSAVASPIFSRMTPMLRRWDFEASARPDYYIAISQHVADRIRKYYHREVDKVIYPPVDTKKFTINRVQRIKNQENDYFLVVSRFVAYKRIDIIVRAFNELGWPLIVIGEGSDCARLKRLAFTNVRFVPSHLTDEQLLGYYGSCRALVIAADEDFGLTAVEAQACGTPVIAYSKSGVAESVLEGVTGMLYEKQTIQALISALKQFNGRDFSARKCRENALRYDKSRFIESMKDTVQFLHQSYRSL